MKKILLGTIALGLAGFAASTAHADAIFTVWTGTYSSGITDTANLASMPSASLETATFTYSGPLNFVNDNPDGGSNTFTDFGLIAGDISNFTSTETLSDFLASTMSTIGETGDAINTYLTITGTYSAGAGSMVTITHDDGASFYTDNNYTDGQALIYSPSPTSQVTESAALTPAGSDIPFEVVYVESNGAPAILQVAVPEPISLSLFGAGLAGLGLIRRRKNRAVS